MRLPVVIGPVLAGHLCNSGANPPHKRVSHVTYRPPPRPEKATDPAAQLQPRAWPPDRAAPLRKPAPRQGGLQYRENPGRAASGHAPAPAPFAGGHRGCIETGTLSGTGAAGPAKSRTGTRARTG